MCLEGPERLYLKCYLVTCLDGAVSASLCVCICLCVVCLYVCALGSDSHVLYLFTCSFPMCQAGINGIMGGLDPLGYSRGIL